MSPETSAPIANPKSNVLDAIQELAHSLERPAPVASAKEVLGAAAGIAGIMAQMQLSEDLDEIISEILGGVDACLSSPEAIQNMRGRLLSCLCLLHERVSETFA